MFGAPILKNTDVSKILENTYTVPLSKVTWNESSLKRR